MTSDKQATEYVFGYVPSTDIDVYDVSQVGTDYTSSVYVTGGTDPTITSGTSSSSSVTNSQMNSKDETIVVLTRIADTLDKMYLESKFDTNGYVSIEKSISANTPKYEIPLDVPARIFSIRSTEAITVNINSMNADDIVLSAVDPPLSIWGLPKDSAIKKIYVTTGSNATNVKILAFG